MNNLKNISWTSRRIFWVILIGFVLIGLFAFFTSRFGQTVILVCCGGIIAIAAIGLLSERGMRRPR